MMDEELYLHIYVMTPLTTLGLRGMWEYLWNGNATPFPSSFQLRCVHADEAKMQSLKENVKMKDRWEMEFSLFKCTRLIFRQHTLWLSWLDTCQTYRLTDYTVLNLTCLQEKLFHARTHIHTHWCQTAERVLKGGDLIADRMLSPENTCWF